MYAHVKYNDGFVANVPLNFIKNFDEENYKNIASHVFWSPNSQDTPEVILKKQGQILTDPEDAMPGYYSAIVLHVAETEEKLIKDISSKEMRKSISKVTDMKQSSVEKNTKVSSKKALIKVGKNSTIRKIRENLQVDSHESDTDDSLVNKKFYQEEIMALKADVEEKRKKYASLKSKYKKLQEKYEAIHELNISLQKKLINSEKAITEKPAHSENISVPSPISHYFTSSIRSKNISNSTSSISRKLTSSMASDKNSVPSSISENISVLSPISCNFTSITPENVSPPLQQQTIPNYTQTMDLLASSVPESEENITAVDFHLSEEKMNLVFNLAKPGQQGDSLFVKNLAVSVFGEQTLATSSVTGQKCRRFKDGSAKPPLCPNKLLYVKGLFQKRIMDEGADQGEVDVRLRKMNAYIGDKIATINRYN